MLINLILVIFAAGYLAIALEHKLGINKAAIALLIGVLCWSLYVLSVNSLLTADAVPEWFLVQVAEEGVSDIPLHYHACFSMES